MKKTEVRFESLRRLLLDLGFAETETHSSWRFEHAGSGAIFLFRPYKPNEHVTAQDLASARTHLDWHGLLTTGAFDDSLTKALA